MTSQLMREVPAFEIEVIPGLEEFASREIVQSLRFKTGPELLSREGRLSLRGPADLPRLNQLKSVVAVHRVELFDLPRPRALLGHQNLARLLELTRAVFAAWPPGTFRTFRINAAGADSPVFARLKEEIAASLGLTSNDREGQLLLTFRRPLTGGSGWEVLVRTSPRPLASRSWRVCDLPGALHASVASVMVGLAPPRQEEVFVNVCCGSGTLLIERLNLGAAKTVTGYDIDPAALDCARANLQASGHAGATNLIQHDARQLPLTCGSVDTVVADLPYGMLLGSGVGNRILYPALLKEAARIAAADASFVLITTQRQLLAEVLADQGGDWHCARTIPIKIPFRSGVITPSIYVLRRM